MDDASKSLKPEEWKQLIAGLLRMLRARFAGISDEDAWDASQEAIYCVLKTKNIRSLRALLHTMAKNAACNRLRRLRRERSKLGRQVPLEVADKADDASERDNQQRLCDAAQIALAKLTTDIRSIVTQKLMGVKFTKIAADLGIPEYRVRRSYHRAIRLMRTRLNHT
jgi:RNA polymerase sigma factor (sigma-70 family)